MSDQFAAKIIVLRPNLPFRSAQPQRKRTSINSASFASYLNVVANYASWRMKWPDQTLEAGVRVTRGAGSSQHLASVLQEGRENANIDAALGFIWRISAENPSPPPI